MMRASPKVLCAAVTENTKKNSQKNKKVNPFEINQTILLGYKIKNTTEKELLYGGVRTQFLSEKPFPLKYIKSETLPKISIQEKNSASFFHDLGIEMQIPKNYNNKNQNYQFYNQINMNIQRQVSPQEVDEDDATFYKNNNNHNLNGGEGFHLKDYFSTLFHPERHHNSSMPYYYNNTNNVMGHRLTAVNFSNRIKNKIVENKTKDLKFRFLDYKRCLQCGEPLRYPLSLSDRAAMDHKINNNNVKNKNHNLQYLRGGPSHPPVSALSIFTRPVDISENNNHQNQNKKILSLQDIVAASENKNKNNIHNNNKSYVPLQTLKPLAYSTGYGTSIRGSGTRGPSAQLYQERLDQKGFGWKKKSRSLWQLDVDTAGFRPRRYF
ncbi:hypothetical protein AGDE_03251 [Angomonas deanei]|uniref:Uncharacterized protein n=1 Tax=Angomonas deanei TaxID=59799 RepID=A0A7G2CFE7_9TRYP|nr:hypothetical protein AGDE_03251 [Angomonas deanei]CAD2217604.1 hypothetical protein, conserved [Angomonas deanei]|eukprot:EPY40676.1 hypothetical protein AGDE_03251 [Angomonas deanei]